MSEWKHDKIWQRIQTFFKSHGFPHVLGSDGEDIDNLIPYFRFYYDGKWFEIRKLGGSDKE